MASSDDSKLGFREQYILASACFHFTPPKNGRTIANCARVLAHAMHAAGRWQPEMSVALHGIEGFPEVDLWYLSLIDLTLHEPECDRLLAGGGNFGTPEGRVAFRRQLELPPDERYHGFPAGAHFTACWLTPKGRAVAEELLARNQDWGSLLTTEVPMSQ